MPVLAEYTQQPSEILDYDVIFTSWLANRNDTPASFTVTADSGIDVVSSELNDTIVKVTLGGGQSGIKYKITVLLTTTAGLVKEADFTVTVKEI